MALAKDGLGERDEAISWLQRAVEERDPVVPFANSFPAFAPLRADPRFQALRRRMHFPEPAADG